jgi:hypothetical protein
MGNGTVSGTFSGKPVVGCLGGRFSAVGRLAGFVSFVAKNPGFPLLWK